MPLAAMSKKLLGTIEPSFRCHPPGFVMQGLRKLVASFGHFDELSGLTQS